MVNFFDKIMSGFQGKTYIGGLGMLCAAYLKYESGDMQGALELAATGVGIIGIGNKIEKTKIEK